VDLFKFKGEHANNYKIVQFPRQTAAGKTQKITYNPSGLRRVQVPESGQVKTLMELIVGIIKNVGQHAAMSESN